MYMEFDFTGRIFDERRGKLRKNFLDEHIFMNKSDDFDQQFN